MTAADILQPGFVDKVHDAQQIFRAAMNAFAHPGSIYAIPMAPTPPAPLSPAAAALILCLADHETPVWLDPALASSPTVTTYIRFHTGASIVDDLQRAAFVVISEPSSMPALDDLPLGTSEYPDRSATIILQVHDLNNGDGWRIRGPGINGHARLKLSGAPPSLAETLALNRSLFPRGIDVLFASGSRLAALPRTTTIEL